MSVPPSEASKDLNIYETKLVESTFVEIINTNKSNHIIGVIYRHPSICPDNVNDIHIRPFLTKLSHEKKYIFVLQVTLTLIY